MNMSKIKYEEPHLKAFKVKCDRSFLTSGGPYDGNGGIEGSTAGLADDWDD